MAQERIASLVRDLPEPEMTLLEQGLEQLREPVSDDEGVTTVEVGGPGYLDLLARGDATGSPINVADYLTDKVLSELSQFCIEGYQRDKSSRSGWESEFDAAMEMLRQESVDKTFPFDGCANVQYPLLTTACLQFNARAGPAIMNGPDIVKAKISGDDPQGLKAAQGDRVSEHMSFQLMEEMPEWQDDTDALLLHLPAAGMAFRQVTWDAPHARPKSEFISAKNLIVNQSCQDLETVPLFTKVFTRYPHQIVQMQREGKWTTPKNQIQWDGEDEEQPQDMLECHVRFDLDDDGYAEPYVVTIHKTSQEVLCIVAGFWPDDIMRNARGEVTCVYRKLLIQEYRFFPDPEGGFYGLGFGRLLAAHNDIINTIINQLLDAATLQNAGGGFIGNGVRLNGGRLEQEPGLWRMINDTGQSLKDNIVPMPVPNPSAAMFNLLGLMIESGKEVAGIKDVLSGEAPANQPATTTLALIEQGLTNFTAVTKRVFRSLKGEFDIVFDLNAAFLTQEAYQAVVDDPKADVRQDYSRENMDIRPVADPSSTTAPQRLGKAQFLWATFNGDPMIDQLELRKRVLTAGHIEDIEDLMAKPDPTKEKMGQEAAAMEMTKLHEDILNTQADTRLKEAQAAKAAADAGKVGAEADKTKVETEPTKRALAIEDAEIDHAHARAVSGGMGGMEGAPGDGAGAEGAGGPLGPTGSAMEGLGMGGVGPQPSGDAAQPGGLAGDAGPVQPDAGNLPQV